MQEDKTATPMLSEMLQTDLRVSIIYVVAEHYQRGEDTDESIFISVV